MGHSNVLEPDQTGGVVKEWPGGARQEFAAGSEGD